MLHKATCCWGCSWAAAFCSSGTATTPTVNNNTTASGNKLRITVLCVPPFPLPTERAMIAPEILPDDCCDVLLLEFAWYYPQKSGQLHSNDPHKFRNSYRITRHKTERRREPAEGGNQSMRAVLIGRIESWRQTSTATLPQWLVSWQVNVT